WLLVALCEHSLVSSSQASLVQSLSSLHDDGGPDVQTPPVHVSPVVQKKSSSHEVPSGAVWCVQLLVSSLHESIVQPSPSSHPLAAPPTHAPPLHASPAVQKSPSSHGSVLFAKTQSPVSGSHESSVHAFVSAHTRDSPEVQNPFEQVSPTVHAEPSLQEAPSAALSCLQVLLFSLH